jgi:hypothetical protein
MQAALWRTELEHVLRHQAYRNAGIAKSMIAALVSLVNRLQGTRQSLPLDATSLLYACILATAAAAVLVARRNNTAGSWKQLKDADVISPV